MFQLQATTTTAVSIKCLVLSKKLSSGRTEFYFSIWKRLLSGSKNVDYRGKPAVAFASVTIQGNYSFDAMLPHFVNQTQIRTGQA